jgi:hypothetical protein
MTSRIAANGIEIAYELLGPMGAPVLMLSNSFLRVRPGTL